MTHTEHVVTGRRGGRSRSRRKLAAVKRNLARARRARWAKKGGRS